MIMTNQQKIEAIAKAFGWIDCGRPTGIMKLPNGKFDYPSDKWLNDANTRPEMLVVMNSETVRDLICLIRRVPLFNSVNFPSEIEWAYMGLSVDQQTFADCWLKAMGLWKDGE